MKGKYVDTIMGDSPKQGLSSAENSGDISPSGKLMTIQGKWYAKYTYNIFYISIYICIYKTYSWTWIVEVWQELLSNIKNWDASIY